MTEGQRPTEVGGVGVEVDRVGRGQEPLWAEET